MQHTDGRTARTAARRLAVPTTLAALAVWAAAPATAHPGPARGAPAPGTVLDVPPERVTLTFAHPMSSEYAQLSVSTRRGGTLATSSPRVTGRKVTVTLTDEAPAGRYRVGYRVLSQDGRPLAGSYVFSVRAPRPGPSATTPGGPVAVAVEASVRVEAGSGGPEPARHIALAAGGAALVAVAAATVRVVLLRRSGRPDGHP
ncbi:copper resistance CopC family protein [Streptomyces sp. JNUCC 64]